MNEETMSTKLYDTYKKLNNIIVGLKKVDFTTNWAGNTSQKMKDDYNTAISSAEKLAEYILSMIKALSIVSSAKKLEKTIKNSNDQISRIKNTPIMANTEAELSDILEQNAKEVRQLESQVSGYKLIKRSYIASIGNYISGIKNIVLDIPPLVEAEEKYNYQDLADLIDGAFKGYTLAFNSNSWARNNAQYIMGSAINTAGDYLAAREQGKGNTDSSGNKPSGNTSSVNSTFTAAYMKNQSTYTIPSEYLSDPQFANMIAAANNCKNVKYSLGANADPSDGYMDCSSFVSYVYNKSGYSFPRSTTGDFHNMTYTIKESEAKPGDMVLFNGHVGIYVGDGKMIHCNKGNWGSGINIMNVSTFNGSGLSYRRMKKEYVAKK